MNKDISKSILSFQVRHEATRKGTDMLGLVGQLIKTRGVVLEP